jgi:hypothetical protein
MKDFEEEVSLLDRRLKEEGEEGDGSFGDYFQTKKHEFATDERE